MFNNADKFFKIVTIWQISLAISLIFIWCLFAKIPANHYTPNLLKTWIFFLIYVILLSRLAALLKKCFILWAKVLFFSLFSIAIGNLFLLGIIFRHITTLSSDFVSLWLYFNPVVVASQCLKNYDYLRGPFFYDLYPVTSYLGNFSYPKFYYVISGYIFFTFLIEFLNMLYFLKKYSAQKSKNKKK